MAAPRLILASRSPQRRAILTQLGIAFEVRLPEPEVEELAAGEPAAIAEENARRKAAAVEGELVLGVDTVVAVDGVPYGKPAGAQEAARTLALLAGRTHEVWSGIALRRAGAAEPETARERTLVRFRELSEADIGWYVGTGEWEGRAGGYAIQGRGAALVERIEGDFQNVVGLPVPALLRLAPELLAAR